MAGPVASDSDSVAGTGSLPRLRGAFAMLGREHWFLLGVLGTTNFFDGYDRGIIAVALKQIRGSFHLSQSSASLYVGALYLGALPAVALTRSADRTGRRRLLIVALIGYTVATGLSAAAPSAPLFGVCQFVARFFITAEAAIVWTMAAEELPASARGVGFGFLAMTSALGVGFGALLFGGVISPLGWSWRLLYVAGIPPLFAVGWLRRRLPESQRFLRARDEGTLSTSWRDIFHAQYRRWLVLVLATAFLAELVVQASVFSLDFLQQQRHISASTASFMLVGAGIPAIPLMVAAGAWSDHYGRRAVGCLFALVSVVGALGFFWLPVAPVALLPFMSLALVGQAGFNPTFSAYTAELFPTGVRSQATAWANVVRVAGDAASFGVAALLLWLTNERFPLTVTVLGLGPLAAVALFWFKFPDTHGRELEDIELPESGGRRAGA
ncbi:MAG TPA: MFS transporter [Acidimicrobiales bacterium]|nr:MFS transporter [Acidimicrobiales bacterium]